MSLLVLCEPNYRNTAWCDVKLKGIREEAARRRIPISLYCSLDSLEAAAKHLAADSSVIVLYDSIAWIKRAASLISELSVHAILSANELDIRLPITYSMVASDVDGAMKTAVDYLSQCGKRRVALVGINRDSWNDMSRVQMLHRYMPDDAYDIFYLDDGFDECYTRYAAQAEKFDAVMCTNDHLAIGLNEFLKARGINQRPFVLSYTDTYMARLYENGVTSMSVSFYTAGRTMVETHCNRLKYGWVSARIRLPSELKIRGSTHFFPYTEARPNTSANPSVYENRGLGKLRTALSGPVGRLERLFGKSDLVDMKLMYCMLCGYSYEDMAEFCFLSIWTARYRVGKIKQILGVTDKAAVASLLGSYIKKENLQKLILEIKEERET